MKLIGVDGAKRGWVAVVWQPPEPPEVASFTSIQGIHQAYPQAQVIAVDIPIGLPRGLDDFPRLADREAKRFLGRHHRSVAYIPPREVLEEPTIETARNRAHDLGFKVQRQAYGLREKALEVANFIGRLSTPHPIREVHPEVSFRALAGEKDLRHRKNTWNGFVERHRLLAEQGLDVLLEPFAGPATVHVDVDDVLDAAVAAWSARRIAEGAAEALGPEGAPRIWY
jgi:predicted RNase H-like nuclease